MEDHTQPSSNSRNVVCVAEHGIVYDHVIHWRDDTLSSLWKRCLSDSIRDNERAMSRTFFIRCVPSFVRLRKKQDGLCPVHYTAHAMIKECGRKRAVWHRFCTCNCAFCADDGCAHGKRPLDGKCNEFTCTRCKEIKCPREHCSIQSYWVRPIQLRRKGGGLYWLNQQEIDTRANLMSSMIQEMEAFHTHAEHVNFSKQQLRVLRTNFRQEDIVVQADFIQNIVHSRGRETSQSYYGKRYFFSNSFFS